MKKTKAFGRNRAINPDKSFPSFLPDGDHFLFTQPVNDVATLMVGSVWTDAPWRRQTRAVSTPPGSFSTSTRERCSRSRSMPARTTSGEPIRLLDDIQFFSDR